MTSANAANSIVSGTGIYDFYSGSTVTVSVTAKDSYGNLITNGGEVFSVKISNLWTKVNDYLCEINGSSSTLASSINEVMTDHNNGTYTYSYTINNTGNCENKWFL